MQSIMEGIYMHLGNGMLSIFFACETETILTELF